MRVPGAALGCILLMPGCGARDPHLTDPGVVCTAIAVSSLNVSVRDAATGALVCDALVIAIQGDIAYELRRTGDTGGCGYAGPEERAGVFEVHATRVGYQAARVTNVRVREDECHVIPVSLTVDLRPGA